MVYLDNTATTFPKPKCMLEGIANCIKNYCGNPGRSSHKLSVQSAEKIYETRELLATLFNCTSENVVFTYNTTYALNIAIKSLISHNSHVLISDIEHNSVLRPIHSLSNDKICSYDIFETSEDDDETIENIKSKIKKNTKLLVCTHSSNVGSRKLPIEKIGALCKENNISFIVDGAQSAGVYDIDIKRMNIDALCIPAHKGLYGPQGLGMILFGSKPTCNSIIQGGTGINSLELEMPDFLPEMHEAGTLSTPLIAGLNESLKWLKLVEISRIKQHEENLYELLISELLKREKIITYKMSEKAGNTLMFNVSGMSSSFVSSRLDSYGICTRSGFHCSPLAHKALKTGESGAVRVGFSVFNTKKDVILLLDALDEILKDAK